MSSEAETQRPRPSNVDAGTNAEPESEDHGWEKFSPPVLFIGAAISLLHIYFNIIAPIDTRWQNGLHFAGFLLLCTLLIPIVPARPGRRDLLIKALNMGIGLLAVFATLFMIHAEDAIYERGVRLVTADWVFGIILILAAIEFTRRTTGWIIPILIILSLSYVAWWGSLLTGVFSFRGLSLETLLFRSIYGDDALFGTIATISSTFVFMFILFGAFLIRSGAGEFVVDLARAVAGRLVGGPGLVAVFASGLTGTISGSAVANTASTGVITIPLMKRVGFDPKFAGGVEAAASTGGQLMPPIMGAGAFVMANFTQISYTTIVAVSVLPAVLYFATVAFFVRIEAKRANVATIEEGVDFLDVLKRGGLPFLLPVTILIGLLVWGYTPTYAAGISLAAVIVASWFTDRPMGPRAILEALALGAKNMITTAVLLCSVGLVVNVIATAGIGNTFSLMITDWAGGSLFIAITLIAIASLVLGMGLPVTAAYIVLATLSAPALYNLITEGLLLDAIAQGQLGDTGKAVLMLAAPDKMELINAGAMTMVQARELLAVVPPDMIGAIRDESVAAEVLTVALLSSHMIIFWLSQDSNVTPPVCLTAFTAAAIAKTPPMATGLASWKIAKGLYVVPLLFAYTPILSGDWWHALEISAFALVGLYALAGAWQGYLEAQLSIGPRLLSGLTGVALLWPGGLEYHLPALVIFALLLAYNLRLARAAPVPG